MNREEGDVVRLSIAGKDFDLPFKTIHGLPQNSVASDEITLEGIQVWLPTKPVLYEAKVSIIKANGKVADMKTFK
jgi:beta-galactosidase/beta-glucuronidase